ncbi:PqiB family protein [Methylovulum psychrotolerans]|uniref:MCE family protein n=1 Tax=Methylovulum psychrotolerans TaxID=1704499 RepID=A0A1Z4BYW8_9GAMM|nr:MlaD family protein [Methylovulum psychrotolerans]ASF46497.1 mammalian cell entry protein [Methylovulum psychrotolerans]POZ53407.1 MCE family protein [Methylovulum psychrotolerans]
MNDFIDPDAYQAEEPVIDKKLRFPLVWLLPLIALLISGWLIYKSVAAKGPTITISFPNADGLEVDKTKIKFLNVEVGKVTDITISDDLQTIQVSAQMHSEAERYLKEQTSFWVVRPQVGLGGVSGLGTLLSGPYIEVKPGDGGDQTHFVGLVAPPLLKTNAEGRQFVLETNNLGSLHAGTPISFHGISVGEVLSHELSTAADAIKLKVFINKPYDQFVRKNTRFWMDSGVDLSASADGFKVRTGPLISLLSGGIAFRTSVYDKAGDVQPENSEFTLYDNYEQSEEVFSGDTLKYVMYFNGSVRGLTEGAPVQLRGIPIGKVSHIKLELDEKTAEIRIPVTVELQPNRIETVNNLPDISHKDIMEELVKKGLRAQLQTGSLLTGQLLIDLDFHPKNKISLTSNNSSIYPEFPTIPSSLDQFTHSAQTIMDKIAKLPLEELTEETTKTMQTLQTTSKAATDTLVGAKDTLSGVKETLVNADKTIAAAHQLLNSLEPGSTTHYELDRLLQEFSQTASSVKQLADYLQQHPDTLIRGKKAD